MATDGQNDSNEKTGNTHDPDYVKPPADDKPADTPPTPTPDPPANKPDTDTSLAQTVAGIQEQLLTLTETVAGIVTRVDPDTTPVRRPWTHYGSR
jgi:hypothetical protein